MDGVHLAIERMLRIYMGKGSVENINILRSSAFIKNFKKNEIILHRDEKPVSLYFICSGSVRGYYIDRRGRDITHFIMEEDGFCCSELFIEGIPVCLCYEALEDAVLLGLQGENVRNLIKKSTLCKNFYIHLLEDALKHKMEREFGFFSKSATERYLEFKQRHGDLEKRIQQMHLASYLGITPVSLSRIKRTVREK